VNKDLKKNPSSLFYQTKDGVDHSFRMEIELIFKFYFIFSVCGKPVYRWPKIVSGENARLGQWPWQVIHFNYVHRFEMIVKALPF
jgi:hypothetical protein